jgi:hypothetical protein
VDRGPVPATRGDTVEDQEMDAHRLDAVAKRLAQSPLSRRMTIPTGGLGLLGLATGVFRQRGETSAEALAAPLTIQSTPEATPAGG